MRHPIIRGLGLLVCGSLLSAPLLAQSNAAAIKNYPDKEKVASAMLKQGMAFINLKDAKSAKYILKELIKQYPASEEAKRAKDQLKGL